MPEAISNKEVARPVGVKSVRQIRKYALNNGKTVMLDGADSGTKSFIAKHLANELLGPSGVVFCVLEWGVWPTSEIPELFYRIRSSQGFLHQVQDLQAEKVSRNEEGYLSCLIASCLYCIWGFVVISLDYPAFAHFSHDEGLDIVSTDPKVEARILKYLPKPE